MTDRLSASHSSFPCRVSGQAEVPFGFAHFFSLWRPSKKGDLDPRRAPLEATCTRAPWCGRHVFLDLRIGSGKTDPLSRSDLNSNSPVRVGRRDFTVAGQGARRDTRLGTPFPAIFGRGWSGTATRGPTPRADGGGYQEHPNQERGQMRDGVVAIPFSVVVAPSSNLRVANATRPQDPMGPSFHMPACRKMVGFPMWGARQSRLPRGRLPSVAAFISCGRSGRFPICQGSKQSCLQLGREVKKPIGSQSEEKPKFPGSGIILFLGFRLGSLSCSRRQSSQ